MPQAHTLSSDEVRQLRDELAEGRSPTVWFTSEAVGVPEGRSGKVIAIDEPAEGDFVQVRPAGSKDTLSFSASEITLVKPPRKRKTNEATQPAAKDQAAPANSSAQSAQPVRSQPSKPQQQQAQQPSKPQRPSKPQQQQSGEAAGRVGSAGGTRRKQPHISGATVTLSADEEGQWRVEVNTGKKRALKPTPVAPSAVAQAAKALHGDVAEAVEPLLQAARERQRTRVEELQRELAEAQRALDEMTD